MKITFLGAARTVTGSRHLVEACGARILLDCGLVQGKRKESFEENRRALEHAGGVDAVVLSHAHIDHSGNLPSLVRHGYEGPIWSTPATRDLCALMLQDSAQIQVHDVDFVNKRRRREGRAPFEPLYTPENARQALDLFQGLPYGRWREIAPGLRLRFSDAGHMLGSAHVWLEASEGGRVRTLLFSGDIGRHDIPIIRDPELPREGADILIVESTYAGRSHPPYAESEADLVRVIQEAHASKSVVLLPAFAVGRTQQLVVALHRLFDRGAIPGMPIHVDSPLATDVTSVFRLHPETYDAETLESLHTPGNPFSFRALRYTRSVEESKALNELRGPAIIISSSGMLEHGRILHHLRNRISDERCVVLITGWQAPHTLGRLLVEGAREVNIFGESCQVRARIATLTGFSGHADQAELDEWVGAMAKTPSHAFVVHGEEERMQSWADRLHEHFGIAHVRVPRQGEAVDF